MSDKITCGDGAHCKNCNFYNRLKKLQNLPLFTRNQMDRCDWFSCDAQAAKKD
ncbi:hypothetical protein RYZ26_07395 [Terasakiella sp. A23]|uniref:hypothetical protein n=1 Tax=Terasakiella sp. FCG-A23 TaxID=3080561 RepID=UPI002953E4B9|nr:hypothetical protein [Terasakiella sp. A23]MDV7339411.1 hypothetical protein [Terasakiella sp. A23]